MIFAPHVEQMRSKQHPEHNVIISRQQLLRETVVRLEQWYPTTISQSTIGRIVDLSQQWNVRVENIFLPTPPDGNCLLYSIMACRKPDSWRHGRSALGFLSDRIQEQVEKEEAKTIKDSLIEHHEQHGNMAEASRLRLAGLKDRYPDIESVPILAEMFGLPIQLHSLTFDDSPTTTFGAGPLVNIGHLMLLNAEGDESGHLVALRDTEPAGSYGVPQATSSTSNVHTHTPFSVGTESMFSRTRTRPYGVGITSLGEVVARSIYSENDNSEDEASTCSSDTSSGSQRSISDGNSSTSVGSSTFCDSWCYSKNRQKHGTVQSCFQCRASYPGLYLRLQRLHQADTNAICICVKEALVCSEKEALLNV